MVILNVQYYLCIYVMLYVTTNGKTIANKINAMSANK